MNRQRKTYSNNKNCDCCTKRLSSLKTSDYNSIGSGLLIKLNHVRINQHPENTKEIKEYDCICKKFQKKARRVILPNVAENNDQAVNEIRNSNIDDSVLDSNTDCKILFLTSSNKINFSNYDLINLR